MSIDTVDTLQQVEQGVSHSGHPVLVVLSWRLLQAIYPSPGTILLAHLVVLFLSMAFFLKGRGIHSGIVALVLIFICIWPFFLGKVVVIWKGISVAAALTAGLAVLDAAARRGKRSLIFIGLMLVFLAAGYRHDAWIAAFPFWIWAGWLLIKRPGLGSPKDIGRVAAVIGAVIAINLAAIWMINQHGVPSKNVWRKTALFDLIGMSHFTRINLLPAYLYDQHDDFTIEDLDGLYFVEVVTKSFRRFPDNQGLKLLRDEKRDPEMMRALFSAWIDGVTDHPLAYIQHRLNFARTFLGLNGKPAYAPTHHGISPNSLGLEFEHSRAGDLVLKWILATRSTILQRPWFFYCLGLATLVLLVVRRPPDSLVSAVPILSGILHGGALTILVHAADSRYHLWALLAITLGTLAALPGLITAKIPVQPPDNESRRNGTK
jgi:hypothetical protein